MRGSDSLKPRIGGQAVLDLHTDQVGLAGPERPITCCPSYALQTLRILGRTRRARRHDCVHASFPTGCCSATHVAVVQHALGRTGLADRRRLGGCESLRLALPLEETIGQFLVAQGVSGDRRQDHDHEPRERRYSHRSMPPLIPAAGLHPSTGLAPKLFSIRGDGGERRISPVFSVEDRGLEPLTFWLPATPGTSQKTLVSPRDNAILRILGSISTPFIRLHDLSGNYSIRAAHRRANPVITG
jgi:hypothetical protein